jgi:hypothetical protein
MAEISALVNRITTASRACFTIISSKFQMPLNSKVVSPNILHIFTLGGFGVFKEIFGERGNVLEWHRR